MCFPNEVNFFLLYLNWKDIPLNYLENIFINKYYLSILIGLPESSVGKKSACNARDPGLIPESGRSGGEGTGYPLQYSWSSLVAQLVRNPSAMRETWVQSLGWKDPLEKGKATHSNILTWRIPWDHKESDMTEQLSLSCIYTYTCVYCV